MLSSKGQNEVTMERLYELLYTIPAKMTEREAHEAATGVAKEIQAAGGAIVREDRMGKRRLAYPILHAHYGYHAAVEFRMASAGLAILREKLALMSILARREIFSKRLMSAEDERHERLVSERMLQEERKRRAERAGVREEATPPSTVTAPIPEEHVGQAKKVSMEELEEKIEEILKEEVK